jgi:UDP-4-amino-4,6-dideoxy-N-acetyl-beta-L-altrosamine transaminase
MTPYIPYGRQDISEDDIQAVIEVLKSDWLTQGPAVPEFEQVVSNYCGANYAVAVNSATSALHLACLVLGLGPNDWLWTSPITFVASANCGLYCGAKVDFVDIDAHTYNMSVTALEEKLIKAEADGCLPKIVIPVHFAGQSCDMREIHRLAVRYGFKVIEDASHAIGGKYLGLPIGGCRYSDITVFSFHPVKIITTAEGGMALTNQSNLAEKMGLLRSHGITRDSTQMIEESHGAWYYEQIALGYNYRMTDLQAALGVSQMKRLESFVARRHHIASRYNHLLQDLPVMLPWNQSDCYSALHLYIIRLNLDEINKTHGQVFQNLQDHGVGVNLHYIPVYRQPHYQLMGFKSENFPVAEKYYKSALTLPLYPKLTDFQQDEVVRITRQSLSNNID